jgi:hypothetical protein
MRSRLRRGTLKKAAPIESTAVPSLCNDNPAKQNAPNQMNINSLLSHLLSNIAQVYFELFNTLSKLRIRTFVAQEALGTTLQRASAGPVWNRSYNDEGFAKAIERFILHHAGSALPGAMVDPGRARHSRL